MISLSPIQAQFSMSEASSCLNQSTLSEKIEDPQAVGRQFGELMVKEILKTALKPSMGGSGFLSSKGPGGDVQFGMIVDTLSHAIASGQSFGFGDMLEHSISKNTPAK